MKKDLRLYYLHDGRLCKTGNRKTTPMFSANKHHFESAEECDKHLNGITKPGYFLKYNIDTFVLLEYFERTNSEKNNTRIEKTFIVDFTK